MKQLNNFIIEKLKLNKDFKYIKKHYFPKNKEELRYILEERLEKDNNANLNDIDISNINNMYFDYDHKGLFEGLDPHNIDISDWDVSNVTNMSSLFSGCKNFEGNGLENWDVSKVSNMASMFYECEKINPDLSDWDVSNVTNMSSLFSGCKNFEGNGLENWDVSNVKYMFKMFINCKNFNNDLSKWDVSNVIDMEYMFEGCKKFKGIGLENWNPKKCKDNKDMKGMFSYCSSLKNKPSWYKK